MTDLMNLREEIMSAAVGATDIRNILKARGYMQHYDDPNVLARAYAFKNLLEAVPKHLYKADAIAGSMLGLMADGISSDEALWGKQIAENYGERTFSTNCDHFAPGYGPILGKGIGGILADIEASLALHTQPEAQDFLRAAEICMRALSAFLKQYAEKAREMGLSDVADTCEKVAWDAPATFRQALQLVWACHIAFVLEGRYAMALGRLDQYLYPFYERDVACGRLTQEEATRLVSCTFIKIYERRLCYGGDDVVNIAIGGVKADGSDAVNDLTFAVLEAVRRCNIPGPNLSARLHNNISETFLDACLKVIGTGLGYPALMNDEVNIPALLRYGYTLEDARGYCMVGCIENFIPGKQPPWSDGRYNTPKYLELALNGGMCMLTGMQKGPATPPAEAIDSMDMFMEVLETQMRHGAAEYMAIFRNHNDRLNPQNYQQPFLSCFCEDCIGRGRDINCGGAVYPSVHGACGMGIATMTDSLAAIEQLVYREKQFTLAQLRDMLRVNFEGYEPQRQMMLRVPKYGNDNDETDKYAVWFIEAQYRIFSPYKTRDGGGIYVAIASNVSNIPAGQEIAATPDGRFARQPVSDAASPMHGRDKGGPTAAYASLMKPDYTMAACGTVVNQKYSPEMFTNGDHRARLRAMIRTYFRGGGQEVQINAVSRAILADAMENPEAYADLVVRVSGFSAYYTTLHRSVQEDILKRTEHEGVS